MSELKQEIRGWFIVVLVLAVFAVVTWRMFEERDFESMVATSHANYHAEMLELQKEMKGYTDKKAADRFTGTQGRALEARIEALEKRLED